MSDLVFQLRALVACACERGNASICQPSGEPTARFPPALPSHHHRPSDCPPSPPPPRCARPIAAQPIDVLLCGGPAVLARRPLYLLPHNVPSHRQHPATAHALRPLPRQSDLPSWQTAFRSSIICTQPIFLPVLPPSNWVSLICI
ncbi:uncharacterized protein LAESUDRAFT_199411 [Laetiporus sulphureus 93-53]|uniref:Uncharacterized protein n=1 Tax=Laetiporus sulphureus 93-53 TaxID=1314785 RepID=A0A165E2P9_9APHY|nr:uncharacterized protein LAESUDRAFT_199411 [Laetiporus sulphureus 93-53]KZT06131.1 hypothetical protein LAESUDRAFT_199411 [Laetiporus sulphureus 93-53]